MTRLSYTLRKHPAARFLALALFIAAGIISLSLLTRSVLHRPVLKSISPAVGAPGDVLILNGSFFGKSRNSSYVELCGNRLTESSYVFWSDSQIKVIVPGNTEDGLVYVVSRGGKSNPEFFANELAIPVDMPENPLMTQPVIQELSASSLATGQLLVVTGRNFGQSRADSNIYFSAHKENQLEEKIPAENLSQDAKFAGFIAPSEADFDIESWSETEIRVRVPDGAATGSVFVTTDEGRSTMQPFTVQSRIGEKVFLRSHKYLVQVGADLYNIKGSNSASVTLHLPRPVTFSLQPESTMTECVGEPSLLDYRGNSIFQVSPADKTSAENSSSVHENFIITCSGLESNVKSDYVLPFKDKNRMLFRTYTRPDELVKSGDARVLELLPKIYTTLKNPYRIAQVTFDYLTSHYKITGRKISADADPLEIIRRGRGDAYDFAVLYAALLRASGIPCRLLSGILVHSDKQTQNHWWNEFYIENFGWIPVDCALGAGMEFRAFVSEQNQPAYYFANIDAQHITFSQSYKIIKQSLTNDKLVSMPRSFALQSIWEESGADVESYSSYWRTPAVLGIY